MSTTEIPRIQSRLRAKALQVLTLAIAKLATQRHIGKLFTRSGGTILYLDLCIKFGDAVTLSEANTLQFIAKHTSIPIPKVHHAFTPWEVLHTHGKSSRRDHSYKMANAFGGVKTINIQPA